MSDKKEKATGSSEMRYRFVTKRDNDLEIIVVRNVLIPKKIHVVNDDIKFTLNPFKRTAKLYVGDRKNDIEVKKIEIDGDTNVNIDLDVTYKISGEAYFKDYWDKKNAKTAEGVSNQKLVSDLNSIKAKIVDGNLSRRDFIKIKEVLNVLLHRNLADNGLNNRIMAAKTLISSRINDPKVNVDLNIIDDIVNDAKIIFEQPINSNNQDEHRNAIKRFTLKDKSNWKYQHGATKFYSMAEKKYSDIEKHLVSEINTQIKTVCARMSYEEIKNIKHFEQAVLDDINLNLARYGIEVTTIRVQHVDQFSEELDAAADKVRVAQKEKEAITIKADAEAAAIRLKGAAEAYATEEKEKAKIGAYESSSLDSTTKAALAGANVSTYNISGITDALGAVANRFVQPQQQSPATNNNSNNNNNNNNFREEEPVNSASSSESAYEFWTSESASHDEETGASNSSEEETVQNEVTVNWNDGNPVVANANNDEDNEFNVNWDEEDNLETTNQSSSTSQSNETQDEEEEKITLEEKALYARLEMLERFQKRTIEYMNSIKDKNSSEYQEASDDLASITEDKQEIEKKLQLKK